MIDQLPNLLLQLRKHLAHQRQLRSHQAVGRRCTGRWRQHTQGAKLAQYLRNRRGSARPGYRSTGQLLLGTLQLTRQVLQR